MTSKDDRPWTIHGTVLTENTRMLTLLKKLKFRTSLLPLGITDVTLRLR